MSARHEIPTQPEPGSSSRRRRKRRRRKRRLGVPAPVVFYTVGVLATMSIGLLYLRGGVLFLGFSVVSSLFILAVLLINEQTGFYRSRRARRHTESRDKFTMLEVAVLFALLLLGIYLTVFELATR